MKDNQWVKILSKKEEKNTNEKIKILIKLFIIVILLYLWFIFFTYSANTFITLLIKEKWFFILSIILTISLIFIDKKFSMNKKVIKNEEKNCWCLF